MSEPPRTQPPARGGAPDGETDRAAEGDDLEITDLHGARRGGKSAFWSAAALAGGTRTPRQRIVRLGGVLVALALVVAVLLYGIQSGALVGAERARSQPSPPPLPTPVLRYPNIHLLQCLSDDAWSPDGRFFAYAGNTSQGCGYGQYFQNVVNIYRVPDGAFVRQLSPDAAIFAALGQPMPPRVPSGATSPPGASFLMYNALLWSRDGSRLAIVFSLSTATSQYTGVAVVRADDGTVLRAVATPLAGTGYLVFDLATGTTRAAGITSSASGNMVAVSAPPALAYSWTATGQLVPIGALPSATAPPPAASPGPIGNPNGDASFSVWQPGQIQCNIVSVPGSTQEVGVYLYNMFLTAWSPDGRYIAAFFATAGRLQPADAPVPDHAVLVQAQAADLPLLPLRDRALSEALHDVGTPRVVCNSPTTTDSAQVAYRPDGRALALLDEQGNFAVYSASTGAALYPFGPLDLLTNTHNGDAPAMRWSPDGTMLLLPDGSLLHVGRLGE